MDFKLSDLDGFAGFAALVNGLILWPLVRAIKKDHGARLTQLEAATKPRKGRGRVP